MMQTNNTSVWQKYTLDKLGNYFNGRAFKKDEWKKEGLPIIRIQNLNDKKASFNYTDGNYEQRYKVKNGDLLVSWAASLGVYIWDRDDAWLNQHIFKVIPNEKLVTKEFLYYLLKSVLSELFQKTHGTGMVHITKGDFDSHEVYLPDIPEQKEIVKTLNTTFPLVAKSQANILLVKSKLAKFRQAVLSAAVTGKLTEEWRERNVTSNSTKNLLETIEKPINKKTKKINTEEIDRDLLPDIPTTWEWVRFEQIGELARGKSKHRPRNDPKLFGGKYPFIQTGDVARSKGKISSYTQTYNEFGLAQSRLFPKGTLCITIAANIADSGILQIDACFPDSIVGFIPYSPIKTVEYFDYFINTAKRNLEQFAPGTAQKNINLEILSQLAVPLPPLAEMEEIVKKVNYYFNIVEKVDKQIERAEAKVSHLTQSILAKIFEGELIS